ncbi:TonB-dependent siderophore receptor [Nibribacter ruber]|uniref:TonB-dependent siderophore receptor n=1 Tax=Nibribacter ruber TaxID=2698458 RepID=A0A6P1NSE7_9BACT|nr:TonB-dependent receptor [Nibribacter ruber]QHL86607.1 TonB-dependent siderophore receptor [Nibribacter ruber]
MHSTYTYSNTPKSLLLLCFFFLSSLSLMAQQNVLRGRITTPDGEPAAYVSVLLKEANRAAITSEEGTYQFKHIPAGTYTLMATCIGFESQEKTISVAAGQTNIQDFTVTKTSTQLQEVTVTGRQSINEKPMAIGKIAIKPLDLPQSTTIIGAEVLEKQQVQTLGEVLQNVNGVYQMGATGGTQEEIAGRGFAFGSSNTFKNGSRFNNGIMPEMSGLERVEVLKGSNAILFGNVAAGGVLNLVTKKPKFEHGGEVSLRAGSYDYYKPAIDVYGAINHSEKVAYRLNTSYLNSGSFRDQVKAERFYINPSLLFKAGAKTDILLEGDYMHDTRTPDYGVGAINYAITDLPRSAYLGVSFGKNEVKQRSAMATITHRLNDKFEIRSTSSFQNYNVALLTTSRPTNFVLDAEGRYNGDLKRGLQRSASDEKYYLTQLDLTGKFNTGFLQHTLLVGADVDKYDTEAPSFNAISSYDVINIYHLNPDNQRKDIPDFITKPYNTKTVSNRFGVYAQDLISVSEKVKVLAGLRYSAIDTEGESTVTDAQTKKEVLGTTSSYDYAFSPRTGVVFQPTQNMSLFVSYANSFTPNTGTDVNMKPLDPSITDQYEVGIKNELLNGLLSANVTAYQIKNSNFAQRALFLANGVTANTNNNIKELAGEVTSQGVEVDIMSKPMLGWSLLGGYSYNDTRYTKSNTYAKNERLRYNPSHTANASLFYSFQNETLSGLNLGATAFYVGDRLAGRNRTDANPNFKLIALPNYMLFDAHVGYTLQRVSVRLKLTNLLNKLSYNAHDDNSINPIAPRQFMTTIAYKL